MLHLSNESVSHMIKFRRKPTFLTAEKLHFYTTIYIIDRRYERNSTIITTNINFAQWDEIFGDPMIAGAIVDRILHHATVVTIKGKSYRLQSLYASEEN